MAIVKHATLVAATVTTFSTLADGYSHVEVVNVNGADIIYFTIDGTTPTTAGDDCHVLPAVAGAALTLKDASPGAAPTVKLLSAGIPKVSARVVNALQ